MVNAEMDPVEYSIRPFRDPDYEACALLHRRFRPGRPLSAEQLRHQRTADGRSGGVRSWYLAIESASDRVVGWGALDQQAYEPHPRRFRVNVLVDPEHQGHGIGRKLFALLEDEARRHGADSLRADVRTDFARGVDFFRRQRFVELRRQRLCLLDVDAAKLDRRGTRSSALRSEGIEIITLAGEGPDQESVRRRYYELVRLTAKDDPELGGWASLTLDQFVRAHLERPEFYPEGTFLARRSSEFVGVTALERVPKDPVRLHIGFAGTAPAWRGRGVATELTRRAIELARSLGYRWMDTTNDPGDRAISAICDRLGFRAAETRIVGEKLLLPGE